MRWFESLLIGVAAAINVVFWPLVMLGYWVREFSSDSQALDEHGAGAMMSIQVMLLLLWLVVLVKILAATGVLT